MAIQIPSAAGFIPNESVMDSIGKMWNLWSPEAKARREAELQSVQAGTRNVNTNTDFLPSRDAQGWTGLGISQQGADTAQYGAETSRMGVNNQNQQFGRMFPLHEKAASTAQYGAETGRIGVTNQDNQFNKTLPIHQQNANTNQYGAETDRIRAGNQNDQFTKNLQFQQEEADRASTNAWERNKLAWQELRQRGRLTDAQINELNNKDKMIAELFRSGAFMADPEMGRRVMIGALKTIDPELAKQYEQDIQSQRAYKQQLMDRAGAVNGGNGQAPTSHTKGFLQGLGTMFDDAMGTISMDPTRFGNMLLKYGSSEDIARMRARGVKFPGDPGFELPQANPAQVQPMFNADGLPLLPQERPGYIGTPAPQPGVPPGERGDLFGFNLPNLDLGQISEAIKSKLKNNKK